MLAAVLALVAWGKMPDLWVAGPAAVLVVVTGLVGHRRGRRHDRSPRADARVPGCGLRAGRGRPRRQGCSAPRALDGRAVRLVAASRAGRVGGRDRGDGAHEPRRDRGVVHPGGRAVGAGRGGAARMRRCSRPRSSRTRRRACCRCRTSPTCSCSRPRVSPSVASRCGWPSPRWRRRRSSSAPRCGATATTDRRRPTPRCARSGSTRSPGSSSPPSRYCWSRSSSGPRSASSRPGSRSSAPPSSEARRW